ncbi:hypothetical protein L6164_008294 [Bauhinia variegata]|uniref:Uncharacterized protein n=1 Tax=Bauhinia variegata TaxID=167791 RepID=A0ACB9PHQ7_BAUVA|nr:hypothetical protein L6164_008294 [Bauhinia variegata]
MGSTLHVEGALSTIRIRLLETVYEADSEKVRGDPQGGQSGYAGSKKPSRETVCAWKMDPTLDGVVWGPCKCCVILGKVWCSVDMVLFLDNIAGSPYTCLLEKYSGDRFFAGPHVDPSSSTRIVGPYWKVLKGRKDGRVSRASETINLPAPTLNVSQLIQSFAKRGLGIKDVVTLSGGHTNGFSRCSSFKARLRNFSSLHDIDPSMNTQFAQGLRKKCPQPNKDRNAGQFLDSTASVFDNNYYKRLMAGKGVFGSDQALFGDYRTRWMVEAFAKDQNLFFKEFTASILKLGNVGVLENG